MTERKYTLSKAERLSWKRYIDLLFEKGESFVAFPLRVVFLTLSKEEELPAVSSILISVSKKKFKHAVKRNMVKRQVREAYCVRKYELIDSLACNDKKILVGFIYIEKEIKPFADIEKAMNKAIRLLKEKNGL